jgi:hypothetical protein
MKYAPSIIKSNMPEVESPSNVQSVVYSLLWYHTRCIGVYSVPICISIPAIKGFHQLVLGDTIIDSTEKKGGVESPVD